MAIIARVIVIIFAYAIASVAAAAVLTLGILTPEWDNQVWFASQGAAIGWGIGLLAIIIGFVAMLPALLVIVLGEGFAVRSIIFYGALGGVLALSLTYGLHIAGYAGERPAPQAHGREVLAAAGIAGGLVYWLFAGRRAGSWK